MMRFFHISIVWGGPVKLPDQLKPIFDLASDWITYGGGNYIIYTSEDVFTWQGRISAIIGPEDTFLLCEISNIENSGGWLAKWIWDWIRKPRENILNYGMLPPLTTPTLK
ncbi:MAG: hypothetical protein WAN35_18855 [Terracidiphilus sp.]